MIGPEALRGGELRRRPVGILVGVRGGVHPHAAFANLKAAETVRGSEDPNLNKEKPEALCEDTWFPAHALAQADFVGHALLVLLPGVLPGALVPNACVAQSRSASTSLTAFALNKP